MSSFKEVRPGTYEFRLELGYDTAGKRIRKTKNLTCRNDTEAKKILARLEVDMMDGNFVDHSNMTFNGIYEGWKVEFSPYQLDPQTQETYEYVIEKAILPYFKKSKIQNLKANDLIKFLNNEKKNGVEQYSLEKRHRCLRSLFKYAMQLECIKKDISLDVPKPKVKPRKKDFYDAQEIEDLLEIIQQVPVHQRLMITLAVTGAMRRGEIMAIDMYKDIDFENDVINIKHSVQKTKKEGLKVKETKTGEERVVTIDEVTMEEIRSYRDEREKEIEQIGDEYKGFKAENGEKVDLLFAHIDGTPYDPNSVSQFWSRILKRYSKRKIDENGKETINEHGLKKISFHDLRHSSASYLLSKGHSMKAIQERLGHSDIKTTMNLYTHVTKEMDFAAGNAFLDVRKKPKKE